MKFKTYLLESSSKKIKFKTSEELQNTIKRDCKKYISLLKGKRPLYRAVDEFIKENELLKKDVRKGRIPSGTPHDEFIGINRWLKQQGHVRRDEVAIAAFSKRGMFGNPYYFFPIGDFDFTFVRAKDFNIDYKTQWKPRDFAYEILYYGDRSQLTTATKKWNEYFSTNENFDEAYKRDFEIWFNCKSYYLCRELDWENI